MHDPAQSPAPRHHLLVAGTGRAGTSALIRYLTGLGLATHLSKHGEASLYDDVAEAGLEDIPLSQITAELPYVIKSPWSYLFVQEILSDAKIALDAVIVPARDLISVAASRGVRQLQAVHQGAPWMTEMVTTWEHWAATPGGTVFSLNPIDQARLLAVGFYQLIEQLVQADVPVLFLAFPRFTSDSDYLYRKLAPLLPIDIDIARARKVHATTFKAEKVRVERELSDHGEVTPVRGGLEYPTLQALDNAALKREVNHLRKRASEAQEQCAKLAEQSGIFRSKIEQAAAEVRCATLASECDALRDQLQRQRDVNALLARQMLALRASKSWRLTLPLRTLTSAFRSRALGRK